MEQKKTMLLTKITNQIPGKEREFLEFMGGTINSFQDWSSKTMDELLESFIEFEENEIEEGLTEKVIDELLRIYVKGYISGEGVF